MPHANDKISDTLAAQNDVGRAHGRLHRRADRHRLFRRLDRADVVAFIQPILIPVAIAVILAYLLDPLVTQMSEQADWAGRRRSSLLFAIAFLSIAALVAWLAPAVSMQATSVGRELPQLHAESARHDRRSHFSSYNHTFGGAKHATRQGFLAHTAC